MSTDFNRVMAERSDKQLAEILSIYSSQYQPEALEAAQCEFDRRGLKAEELVDFAQHTRQVVAGLSETLNPPLSTFFKALTVVGPVIITVLLPSFKMGAFTFPLVLLLQYAIHRLIKSKGYVRMAGDFKNWVIYSYYIYIVVLLFFGLAVLIWG